MNVLKVSIAACALMFLSAGAAVADGGNGLLEFQPFRMHLAKGGRGWIEVSGIVTGDQFDLSDFDMLANYGVKNLKSKFLRIGEQKMRFITRGEFTDILQFMAIVESSSPLLLRRDLKFDMSWDGKVLKFHIANENLDTIATRQKTETRPILVLTTEGRFTANSTGELSEDQTKITVMEQKELVLEIEGLGVK